MTNRSPPPIKNPMIDNTGAPTMPWALFFNQMFFGDAGEPWDPEFTGLTETGAAQVAGRYYKFSNYLVLFRAVITPATDTSAVQGSTYIHNFPLQMAADAPSYAITPPVTLMGACAASSNRIYVPTWTSVTVPITITGLVEAR